MPDGRLDQISYGALLGDVAFDEEGQRPKSLDLLGRGRPFIGLVVVDATATALVPDDKPVASMDSSATGANLYVAQCQSCHGDREGVGATAGAPLHDETGHTWHHPDAELKTWVKNGKSGFEQMSAFQDKLSDSEVDAILAYIKTWWTEAQRQGQADVSQRYQETLDRQRQGR